MGRAAPYRLFIVEPASDLRWLFGLIFATEPDFEVVGQASDLIEGEALTTRLQPDAVLVDVDDLAGLDTSSALKGRFSPTTRVVVTGTDLDSLRQVVGSGWADLYIEKGLSGYELVEAIRRSLGGSVDG